MKLNIKQWSLKTRITLFTLAIFVAGIWSLSFYASHMLRVDIEGLLGEQQRSSAAFVAKEINDELEERFQYLQATANSISPAMLRNAAELQTFLEQKKILQIMFNAGAFITRTDGTAIASIPLAAERIGVSYMDRDHIAAALKQGKSMVGLPVIGKKMGVPVVAMGVPIHDANGKVIGSLTGATNLGKSNFLDKITVGHYGKSGGFVLLVPSHRLIVTATDKSRVMQVLPAPGVVPAVDRFLDGDLGSIVYVNPLGVEVLGSSRAIPAADWLLGITLPTTEAFAPIYEMQRHVLLATLLLTLLAAGLTWWMLRQQLSPILDAVKSLRSRSDNSKPPLPLPITSQDEIGTLLGSFNHLLEDLTQREAALKDSDEHSRHIINASPIPLALNDELGNITFINHAFTQTLGYTLSEIPTLERWWPRAYPDPQYRKWVADSWQKNLDDAKRTNQPFAPLEMNICCKNGSTRTFLVSAAAFEGSFAKTHLVILYDITERKQIEQALLDSSKRLNDAQSMAHIGNWTANMASGELTWSDEIYRIFGHEPRSFKPSVEAFKATIHPDDIQLVQDSEKQAQLTGQHNVVHRIVRPDGSIRYVHELAQAETDADGKLLYLSGTVQDITERKMAELAQNKALKEAERANKAKSEFLSSMSHELRTPMNAILGFAQIMDYDTKLPEEYRHSVNEILSAGFHLLDLINEVLDLSQIESGQYNLTLQSVVVCEVVEESLHLLGVMAEKRNIQISHVGLKGATVHADRTRLKQVLINLVSNAIKYNRVGGSVHIKIIPQGRKHLRVVVNDTGPGIPAARLPELFLPFNRLGAENSNILGTGIGLTITRRIVEAMGGSVGVESEAGVGSTFWIELPLEFLPPQTQEQTVLTAAAATPAPSTEAAQYTVLYIEDNPSNLRLVAQLLIQRKHIRLITAHTPELGIELATVHQPDLILLDINMPNMDGYQVLKVFKEDAQLKNIPVIAITANAMTRDIERGKAAGFNDYLTKPLDVPHFYGVIDRMLNDAQTGKQ